MSILDCLHFLWHEVSKYKKYEAPGRLLFGICVDRFRSSLFFFVLFNKKDFLINESEFLSKSF